MNFVALLPTHLVRHITFVLLYPLWIWGLRETDCPSFLIKVQERLTCSVGLQCAINEAMNS